MYSEISKPKRWSMAAGVVQVIRVSLRLLADRGVEGDGASLHRKRMVQAGIKPQQREDHECSFMNFMNADEGWRRYDAGVETQQATPRPAGKGLSLRLQINLIVGVLSLLFVAALMWLHVRNVREAVQEEVVAANRVAAQMLERTAWRYAAQGQTAMLGFLQGMGRVRANDISLFGAQGELLYASPPSTYKAGRDAPDWFDRLVQPALPESVFEFPDGRLVVRPNASRAVLDAWDDLLLLGAGALALLLGVQALAWLLVGRTVAPFGRILGAMRELEQGRFDIRLPALPGREAGSIGSAFNHMAAELQGHIDTERRAMRAEMALSDQRELTRWIEQHIEAERRLIARELHDELGQSVTAMRSMALSIAARQQGRDAESEGAARLIADESSRLYDAMHGIIPRLSPLVLDRFGLGEALADLAERTRRNHGVAVQLEVQLGDSVLSPDTALALYRAAQEGMSNALRHGQARHLDLRLSVHEGWLLLVLDDDGRGMAAQAAEGTSHHGLRWMRERAEALGGQSTLEPRAQGGMRLSLRLPAAAGSRSAHGPALT